MAENDSWTATSDEWSGPAISVSCTGPEALTLRVTGEVDSFGTPALQVGLDGLWSQEPSRVTVDLTGVTFLGLPGLHALLGARATARQRRVRLRILAGSEHVYRLLHLIGAGDVAETCTPRAPSTLRIRGLPELDPVMRALRWGDTNPAGDLQEALRSVAETAVTYLPGAEGAGFLLVGPTGRLESHAATDSVVQILDLVQQRIGVGPAVQSAVTGRDVVVDDLPDDTRWPEVVAEAAALGVRSMLCLHLGVADVPLGVLTVYSSAPAAFAPSVNRRGQVFAAIGAMAVAASRQLQCRPTGPTRTGAGTGREGPGSIGGFAETGEL